MPCQDCGGGVWECGPSGAALCMNSFEVTPIATIERKVCLRKQGGECEGRVTTGASCGSGWTEYEFTLEIGAREDQDGNCIVHYSFQPKS